MAKQTKPADWKSIEADYRSGTMPVREMARWFGVNEATLRKRAKTGGWVRKSSQVAAPEVVQAEPVVRTLLTSENTDPKAIVGRGRNLVLRMLDELDTVTSRQGDLEEFIIQACAGDQSPKRREAMLKAVQLPTRANTIKALALAFKTLAEAGAPAGKKAEAQEAARSAGEGTGWGDDLAAPTVN